MLPRRFFADLLVPLLSTYTAPIPLAKVLSTLLRRSLLLRLPRYFSPSLLARSLYFPFDPPRKENSQTCSVSQGSEFTNPFTIIIVIPSFNTNSEARLTIFTLLYSIK